MSGETVWNIIALVNCSLYHCELSWNFHQNLLPICCWVMAGFPIGQSAWCQNLITYSFCHANPTVKFHRNPSITFWVILLTDKQTDRKKTDKQQTNFTKSIVSLTEIIVTLVAFSFALCLFMHCLCHLIHSVRIPVVAFPFASCL